MRMTTTAMIAVPAAVAAALLIAGAVVPALAQTTGTPALPGAGRAYSPEQLGAISSPNRYMITSAANDHGAFLWIIDTIERKVTLCEQSGGSTDFVCNRKSL